MPYQDLTETEPMPAEPVVIGTIVGLRETAAPVRPSVIIPFVEVPTHYSDPTDREIEEADQVMDNEPLT